MVSESRRVIPVRFLLGLALSAAIVLIALAPLFWFRIQTQRAFKGYADSEIRVHIARGSTVSEIGELLEAKGVIASSSLFRVLVYLNDQAVDLKAGEYEFSGPASLDDVVEQIRTGRVYYHRVTIPEGLEIPSIAETFVQAQFGTTARFLSVMRDTSLISDLDPAAKNLEGYLFPETYFLTAGMNETEIVTLMLQNFRRILTPENVKRAEDLGMTIREVVTLASLIEKETALDRERPLVAAVFHNRLRRNMRLACDPTVIYAVKRVKEYDGVINQSDLSLDSPYNTYIYPGLPPGPIANPGHASIEAALFPAESDFLYFVSRNDGSHTFSKDYRNHSNAVQRHQR